MIDDGSYCLLWDSQNDIYIGVQQGLCKGNVVCCKIFCEWVNSMCVVIFCNVNVMVVLGFDVIIQWFGVVVLVVILGLVVGMLEVVGVVVVGVVVLFVVVGLMVIGLVVVGGMMWYCLEG